jgi:hypothetical protein
MVGLVDTVTDTTRSVGSNPSCGVTAQAAADDDGATVALGLWADVGLGLGATVGLGESDPAAVELAIADGEPDDAEAGVVAADSDGLGLDPGPGLVMSQTRPRTSAIAATTARGAR